MQPAADGDDKAGVHFAGGVDRLPADHEPRRRGSGSGQTLDRDERLVGERRGRGPDPRALEQGGSTGGVGADVARTRRQDVCTVSVAVPLAGPAKFARATGALAPHSMTWLASELSWKRYPVIREPLALVPEASSWSGAPGRGAVMARCGVGGEGGGAAVAVVVLVGGGVGALG